MPKKIIHYDPAEAGALHCDNPRCGHDLPKGPFKPELIGTPCPKCDSNMLTREDYEVTMKFFRWIDWLNKWFGWLGTESPSDPRTHFKMTVQHHDGKTIIERIKE